VAGCRGGTHGEVEGREVWQVGYHGHQLLEAVPLQGTALRHPIHGLVGWLMIGLMIGLG